MLDINNAINNPKRYEHDPEGNMVDLDSWSPLHANREASLEGIELTEEHWEVIYFLRERFREHGNADSARAVLHDLEEKFCESFGRGHLYELFPGGPVGQASRIAGLPLPPHTEDRSFGSMM
ncbi:MAG: TusE/DsrC/DsvC family sulfur relay protein [Nitrosomonadales bacterium]|nr:TusE/DsrC/DsvC family sulfur relay protein [Nitrosomonadales bacterium]